MSFGNTVFLVYSEEKEKQIFASTCCIVKLTSSATVLPFGICVKSEK